MSDANSVAIGQDKNIYVAGDIGQVSSSHATGETDALVSVYSPDGTPLRSLKWGTGVGTAAYAICVDGQDGLLVVGSTRGNLYGANDRALDVFVRQIDLHGEQWTLANAAAQ